tara:strand:+ start:4486 stop:5142 length:657 start_codon:yes stop_codon:yes gene_type:complete
MIHLLAPKNKDEWNPIWVKCYKSIQNLPYSHKIWTNEDIDLELEQDDKEFFNVLNTLPSIYKYDYIRYVLLHNYGGAYIDMDVEITQDFFPLLNPERIYIAEGDRGHLYQNSIMITHKQHYIRGVFWDRLKSFTKLRILNNLLKAKDYYNTIRLVGSLALEEYIIRYQLEFKNDPQIGNLFETLGKHHFGSLTNEVSFARHYSTKTWLGENQHNTKKF